MEIRWRCFPVWNRSLRNVALLRLHTGDWGLRDYKSNDQLGLEKTPEEYVDKIVKIFHEVKRVLKTNGILWLNLGDSYNGSQKGSGVERGIYQQSKIAIKMLTLRLVKKQ